MQIIIHKIYTALTSLHLQIVSYVIGIRPCHK